MAEYLKKGTVEKLLAEALMDAAVERAKENVELNDEQSAFWMGYLAAIDAIHNMPAQLVTYSHKGAKQ